MKKSFILFLLVLLATACTDSNPQETSTEGLSSPNHNEQHLNIDFLQKENDRLKSMIQELEDQNKPPAEIELSDFRETLNLTFKLINAMELKDYKYIESVSSPTVMLNKEKNTFTTKDGESEFLKSANLGTLEYRFFHKSDDTSMIIGLAKITDHASEINFQYTKTDGKWLFNGFITN